MSTFETNNNQPVLTEYSPETSHKPEETHENAIQKTFFEIYFDLYDGPEHLEALTNLSEKCVEKINSDSRLRTCKDLQEAIRMITELCEIPNEVVEISDMKAVNNIIENAILQLDIELTSNYYLSTWTKTEELLQENFTDKCNIYEKAVEILAELTAKMIGLFHKIVQLLLVKRERWFVVEIDSLTKITKSFEAVLEAVAKRFSEKLKLEENTENTDNVQNLTTNIFMEALNSKAYIHRTFNLMIPVLQIGAL